MSPLTNQHVPMVEVDGNPVRAVSLVLSLIGSPFIRACRTSTRRASEFNRQIEIVCLSLSLLSFIYVFPPSWLLPLSLSLWRGSFPVSLPRSLAPSWKMKSRRSVRTALFHFCLRRQSGGRSWSRSVGAHVAATVPLPSCSFTALLSPPSSFANRTILKSNQRRVCSSYWIGTA